MDSLDSNVWFYAFADDEDLEKHRRAKELVLRGGILVPLQVIGEVGNSLSRKKAFTEDRLQKITRSFFANYSPIALSEDDFVKASNLRSVHHFSYWDSLMIATSLHAGALIFCSEDMHHGLVIDERMTILNPFR